MFAGRLAAQAARASAPRASIASRTAFRTYATPASQASTRPPIALFGIDGTYASALVSLHMHFGIIGMGFELSRRPYRTELTTP
jgi:hypothetical protein